MKKIALVVLAAALFGCSAVLDPPYCSPPPCGGSLVCTDDSGCNCICVPDP